MSASAIQLHRWNREEYEHMTAAGIFLPDARLELIDGEIIEMTAQGSVHSTAIRLVEKRLTQLFAEGFDVRTQMPLATDSFSEPEREAYLWKQNFRPEDTISPITAPEAVISIRDLLP